MNTGQQQQRREVPGAMTIDSLNSGTIVRLKDCANSLEILIRKSEPPTETGPAMVVAPDPTRCLQSDAVLMDSLANEIQCKIVRLHDIFGYNEPITKQR